MTDARRLETPEARKSLHYGSLKDLMISDNVDGNDSGDYGVVEEKCEV